MKKLITLILLCLIAENILAQPVNVVTAYNYLNEGMLDKAKEAIDQAANHEKTKNWAKTWKYRGDVYLNIYNSDQPNYQSLHPNPLLESYNSFLKAKELPEKPSFDMNEVDRKIGMLRHLFFQEGVNRYNEKEYELAFENFESAVKVGEQLQIVDSLAIFNCGLALENAKKTEQALFWYKKSMSINYHPARTCQTIVYLLESKNRSEEAYAQLQECRSQFPENQDLLISELNYQLKYGELEKALSNLEIAIKNDPENAVLHYVRGTILDQKGQKDQALVSLKEAIRVNPDYFDALYNIGAIHFNRGADLTQKANDEPDVEKSKAMSKEANALFHEALPYLEKAQSVNPTNKPTLAALKSLYSFIGDVENFNRIKKLLED